MADQRREIAAAKTRAEADLTAAQAALADKSEEVRRQAAYTLGRIAPEPKQAAAVLIKAFEDENDDVRNTAAEAVANFGAAAVAPLMKALDSADSTRTVTSARSECAGGASMRSSAASDGTVELSTIFIIADRNSL